MVSVVIPTHNRADLIGRAIVSVLNQSYKDIELLIVSDGSTDETKTVVDEFINKDKRVRYHEYFPSKGGNFARNAGIHLSVGEYVAFLDDDDEWLPDKLTKQLDVMQSDKKNVLVYTGCNIIYVNDGVKYSAIPKLQGDLGKQILLDNYVGSTSTVILKKSVLSKSGEFDENLQALQDYDLWIRIAQQGHVGVVSEQLINYYNYRGKQQVSALTARYEKAFEYMNVKYVKLLSGLSKKQMAEKKINEKFLLGNKAMRNNNPQSARRYFREILQIKWSAKAFVYLLLSYTSFKTVLKFRSLI